MSAKSSKKLTLAGDPSVQLLPPMVRERAKVRESRRMMILLMILALVVVAGGVTFAFTRSVAAQAGLAEAQARTDALLAEQATYAEAASVADLVEATKSAQLLLTATEADWASIYSEISRRLASSTSIDSGVVSAPAPWEGIATTTSGVNTADGMISVSIVVQSKKVITAAEISAKLATMTGYASSWITGTTFDEVYLTNIVITLDADALTHRFADATAEADAADETDESGEPSDEPTEEAAP